MARKKLEQVKIENSMAQLVSGIVPDGGRGGTGSMSPNKINDSTSLALQVRSEFITLNYPLLSKLYQQFGVIQSLVEVPVLDAFRGGLKISAYEKKVVVPEEMLEPFSLSVPVLEMLYVILTEKL